ncbi:MAG: ABC transporter ATP-binding protein/permease, partial [Acholeplasmataceae bacterium]
LNRSEDIMPYVLLIVLAILIRYLAIRSSIDFTRIISARVRKKMRERIYLKMANLGFKADRKYGDAEITQLTVEGVEQLDLYYSIFVPKVFYGLAAPLTVLVILSLLSMRVALVLFFSVPLIPLLIVGMNTYAKKKMGKHWKRYTSLGDTFLDRMRGLTTLKIFQADRLKHDELNEQSERFRKSTMSVLKMQLNSITIMDLVAFGGAALAILFALADVRNGLLDPYLALFVILLSAEFFLPLRSLGSAFHVATNGLASYKRIDAFLKDETMRYGTKTLGKAVESIRAVALSYAYSEDSVLLQNVSFTFKKPGFYAIAGRSGSGKSTLARLFMGFDDRYQGSLTFNDQEVGALSLETIAEHVTIVDHESHLFNGSVRDNLTLGNRKAEKEAIEAVLRTVDLYDLFMEKPEKLDYLLYENGANLSGGQRQRLLVARALLMDRDVYIFDESTASVDAESEAIIIKALEELAEKRIVIMITHKLYTITRATHILYIDDHTVCKQGTHDELIRRDGPYARTYREQKELIDSMHGGDVHA